jgi:superfamily I DNA and/or RNA helicase
MLTRARRGLIVVGNKSTLLNNPIWRKWIEWCEEHKVIVDETDTVNFNSFEKPRYVREKKGKKLDYEDIDDFDF